MPDDLPHDQAPLPTPAGDVGRLPAGWAPSTAPRLAGPPEPAADLARYLAALRRFRWLIAAVGLAGLAVGVAAGRYVRPLYEAQATIWVETPDRGDRGPIRQDQLLTSAGWLDLLKTYIVLDDAVSRVKLYLTRPPGTDSTLFVGFALRERFRPGQYKLTVDKTGQLATLTEDGLAVERVTPGDSIGRSLGFNWAPARAALAPGTEVEFGVTTPRDAALTLAGRLRTTPNAQGTFLRIDLDGPDPAALAATVNAVTERFVQVADELKRAKLTELARILEDQLRQAEQSLRRSEAELQGFRVQTITLPSDRATPVAPGLSMTQDPVLQSFFNMKIELEQVRRDRDAIGRGLFQVGDSGLSTEALEGIASVQRSTELVAALRELTDKRAALRALRYRYTDEHPPLQALVGTIETLERRAIPAIAQALLADLASRERELDQRVQSASRELQQIPPRAIQEARLERDVVIAGTLYTTLQQRYEEARLAEASSIPDVRILDSANVPDRPIKNRAMYLVLVGLLGGLGAGVGGALVLDRFDRRVRYPEQVTTDLGLPILGVIPHFAGRNGTADDRGLPIIEAVRGVRLSVTHAYGAAGPLIVTVTSPGAADGKSFVASNLALSFAHAGHRTLLVDGDSRRGSLHRVVQRDRKPGLTDVLGGGVSAEAAIRETDHAQLHFLACGSRAANAPELLGSARLVHLLTSLRAGYGVIIVDSPPMSAGVDALALGTATGNLLLVLRTGATDRDMAEAKLEVLDRLPVRVLGAVMNGVKEWGAYRYYTYYLPGYEIEDERQDEKKLVGGAS